MSNDPGIPPVQPPPQPQQPSGYPPPGYQAPPPGYQAPPPGYQAPPPGYPPPGYQAAPSGYQVPPPAAPGDPVYASPEQDAAANKAMAILAYIGILWVVTLLAAPKTSRFARFHANQGLVLFLAEIAYGVVWGIVNAALLGALVWSAPAVAAILTLLFSLVWLAAPVLAIVGIVNAAQGRFKPLPVIGGITILR